MPRTRSSGSLNSGNLLAGITPDFDRLGAGFEWAILPGNPADFVSEDFDVAITTPGTANANGSTITWDMGRVERCAVWTDYQSAQMLTWASKDGIIWKQCSIAQIGHTFAGLWRFIELRVPNGVGAINYIKVIAYRM